MTSKTVEKDFKDYLYIFPRVKDFIDQKEGMKIIFHLYIFPPSELQGMKIDVHQVLLFLLDRFRYRGIS